MSGPSLSTIQSIHQRLLNKKEYEDFNGVLARYVRERLLYRLGRTKLRSRYTVKGATLLDKWLDQPPRSTRDLDLTHSEPVSALELSDQLQVICAVEYPEDGVTFELPSLKIRPIRGEQEERGLRVRLDAHLGQARIPIQIDLGFGDVITPAPQLEELPTLLDLAPPIVQTYPPETFVAEKFEAMVQLEEFNTRYKDFADIAQLSVVITFQGAELLEACRNTFTERGTSIRHDDPPRALRSQFYVIPPRLKAWQSFSKKNPALHALGSFQQVGELVILFLAPLANAIARDRTFDKTWAPSGPWH